MPSRRLARSGACEYCALAVKLARALLLAGPVAALLAFGACSKDDAAETPAAECVKDTDCSGSKLCVNGSCIAGECAKDDDCTGTEICVAAQCLEPGRCANPSDETAVLATYDAPGVEAGTKKVESRQVARTCGIDCLFSVTTADGGGNLDQALRDCTHACILETIPLSDDCTWCLVGSVDCGRQYCLTECLDEANEAQCFDCVCGNNVYQIDCIAVYEACSGVKSTTCDGL